MGKTITSFFAAEAFVIDRKNEIKQLRREPTLTYLYVTYRELSKFLKK